MGALDRLCGRCTDYHAASVRPSKVDNNKQKIDILTINRVYVGYPRIAQGDVNKATLNITNLVFSNPSPTSIHINQTQVLGNKAIYHPTIYGFNATIMLVGATAPLATLAVPQTEAEDGAIIVVNTDLSFANSDAVTNFTKAVLGTESFELNIYGRPDLKEGPLPTSTVTFNKTVAMNGNPPLSYSIQT